MKNKIFILLFSICICSCSKAWLDERSDKTLSTPSGVDDLEQIINNAGLFSGTNEFMGINELLEAGSDNHIMSQTTYDANAADQPDVTNAYIFAKDIFGGKTDLNVWNVPYKRIYTANVVLDKINDFKVDDSAKYKRIKGEALFHRTNSFYWLSQTYMEAYDANNAAIKWGIPLRLSADPNNKTTRSTMEATYRQMIADAKEALPLLPPVAANPFHPSAAADAAMLARIYLAMQDYASAGHYANTALQMQNELLDFNTIDTTAYYTVPRYNKEVLFSDISYTSVFFPFYNVADTVLYGSYANDDLRRPVFFKPKDDGLNSFNGSYDGSPALFGGIATDEVWLISAECKAKTNDVPGAMSALNHLLQYRYKTGAFIPLIAADADDALQKVRSERRKELCFRGMRWIDLKRYNKEGAGISITHIMNGLQLMLPPNDQKWAYPIPDDIILFTGIPQNKR